MFPFIYAQGKIASYIMIFLAITCFSSPAIARTVKCPAFLTIQGKSFVFENATAYDGLPKHNFVLRPDQSHSQRWTWQLSPKNNTLYIQCHYKGTQKTRLITAKNTTRCTLYHPMKPNTSLICR